MRVAGVAALGLLAAACGARTGLSQRGGDPCGDAGTTRECSTLCGTGTEYCEKGIWAGCDAPRPLPPQLTGVLRDFDDTHPDFERGGYGDDRGIVTDTLGADDLPVYAGGMGTLTTTGRAAFDQWFRDVPGVNRAQPFTVDLAPSSGGRYRFSDATFFPLDGQLLGNQGRDHNYHFTFQALITFAYRGGERFSFAGDDDVFVFINRRLVIDLGGVHGTERAAVDLDASAAALGLEPGGIYTLHFFFAERHTTGSTFLAETTIADTTRCPP